MSPQFCSSAARASRVALSCLATLTLVVAPAGAALRTTPPGLLGPLQLPPVELRDWSEARGGAWLGVGLQPLTAELADVLDLPAGRGVLITEVLEDSPADDAGLRKQDVVLSLDGHELDDPGDLTAAVRAKEPGDEVELRIARGDSERAVRVTLGIRPPDADRSRKLLNRSHRLPRPGMRFWSPWPDAGPDADRGLLRILPHRWRHQEERNRLREDVHRSREIVREELERLRAELSRLRREIAELERRLNDGGGSPEEGF